jgi:hypothetical protein
MEQLAIFFIAYTLVRLGSWTLVAPFLGLLVDWGYFAYWQKA